MTNHHLSMELWLSLRNFWQDVTDGVELDVTTRRELQNPIARVARRAEGKVIRSPVVYIQMTTSFQLESWRKSRNVLNVHLTGLSYRGRHSNQTSIIILGALILLDTRHVTSEATWGTCHQERESHNTKVHCVQTIQNVVTSKNKSS